MTAFEQWQMEKYGNLLPQVAPSLREEMENVVEEIERYATWVEAVSELQMFEHE